MSSNKLDPADLARILPLLDLPPDAAAVVLDCRTASAALAWLVQSDLLLQAARLCAHALPARERVWWATRCAHATATDDLPAVDREACSLAEEWVRRRSDETRRAAMDKALQAGCRSPESWAAVAAFWSGGSMAPAGQPAVPPPPHLPGVAVAGAVVLASVRRHAEHQGSRLQRFIASAQDIAGGGAGHIAGSGAGHPERENA